MYIRKSKKYGKNVRIIYPGEFFVSKDNELIGTLLGSCVSVCLFEPELKVSGMNHYMLPGRISKQDIFADRSARYGITAINELLTKIEKFGAKKKNLIAKVFGGGHVLSSDGGSVAIPHDNIRVAKVLLEMEDIPIDEIDVGDRFTRKLLMDVNTGKVYLKKTVGAKISTEVIQREKKFAEDGFKCYEQD